MIEFIIIAIWTVLCLPYYFFKKKNFIILIDKLSKNYGKNIVSAIKNLYFIKNTIIIVLTSPFILKFFQIFSKNFSVNLVYVENTAAEIIRKKPYRLSYFNLRSFNSRLQV